MKIGIPLSRSAYTPESYAYEKYLTGLGHIVEKDYVLDPNNDINLYFMGTKFFWEKKKGIAKEIHEYQSLSTPPYPHFKNLIKNTINKKPEGRIFLNKVILDEMNFNDDIPFIYRDMGVDNELFQKPNKNPKYDVIYCGSISGREGLIEVLLNISKTHSVIVIGDISKEEKKILDIKNITLMGKISREDLPAFYREARFGLNFTPDIYPYNIQTSTKTLEYLASGLGVISNKYKWSENFFNEIGYRPIWLNSNNLSEVLYLDDNEVIIPNTIEKYSWDNVLQESNLECFLRDCINEEN